MRGYKIVTQILLIFSVINFAFTAPTVVREHRVRGIESNDGPGPSNPAPIDSTIPLPGPGSTAAQPHSLSTGPSSPQDLYTSPVPTSQGPIDEPHPLNPISPLAHGSQESNPSSPLDSPTHESGLDINSAPPGSLRFKHVSSFKFGSTSQGVSHPPGFPQIPASPEIPQIVSSPDKSYSSQSWLPTDSDSGSANSRMPTGRPQIPALPEPPQIVSSPDKSSSSSSWKPTDSDSSSTSPWRSQDHATPAWSSQAHVRPPPNLPWAWSQPIVSRPNLPWKWSQPTIISRPNLPWKWSSRTRTRKLPWLWSSRTRTRTRVRPSQNPGAHLPTEQSHPSSSGQLVTGGPHLPTRPTDDGPSLITGPTDYHPQPAPPSNPGPSTELNPPPHPEEHDSWMSLTKSWKGKLKRGFSASGSLHAE